MPYLRLYSQEMTVEQKRQLAKELTDAVLETLNLPEQARQLTTIQFVPYRPEDFAIGGELASDSHASEYLLELTDRHLTHVKKQALVESLTPLLARLLAVPSDKLQRINVRFLYYEPGDIAVGGVFLGQ